MRQFSGKSKMQEEIKKWYLTSGQIQRSPEKKEKIPVSRFSETTVFKIFQEPWKMKEKIPGSRFSETTVFKIFHDWLTDRQTDS